MLMLAVCVGLREWSLGRDGRGQVCWVARQPSKLPYHWSILVFNMSVKEKSESNPHTLSHTLSLTHLCL